jgi:Asp-tRNA(Asn)/Glu-tRNA(Gln) amidotransferase A subunit family amidase
MKAVHSFVLAATLAIAWPLQVHGATFDLSTATIADINAAIDSGALTSEKLVALYLKRIEAYDKHGPKVNAVITLNPKALEEARALDAERKAQGRRSPLHGLPVVLKDLIDVAGMPTTAGFKPFGAPVPVKDAGVVTRLKDAGAIVLAKVSTVNWFGRDNFGPTHPIGASLNPYNVKYSAGGSSNGPGVAMATYFATVGIGTDTGGSVQRPSAYNSIVGMVATQGLISRTGIVPRGPTHDRAGPMARSVFDVTVLLSTIAGWDGEDLGTYAGLGHFPQADWAAHLRTPSLQGRRIGILREMITTFPEDEEVRGIFERAVADMRKAGALIVDPVLTGIDIRKESTESSVATYELLSAGNVYFERLGPDRPYQTMEEMIRKVGKEKFTGRYVTALSLPRPDQSPDFQARYRGGIAIRKMMDAMIERYDLDAFALLLRATPPLVKDLVDADTRVVNSLTSSAGLPGVIVPGGYTKDNLPVGIQFIGKSFDDLRLLQVAYGYEQSSKRRKTPEITPPLPGERFEY